MNKKELTNNQKLFYNLIASFAAFAVSFGINFFLSPYIVSTVGVEAYGFVNLANNFISYASLITVALNALAGRFITIKIHKKDYEGANKYYTSVFIGNAFLSLILLAVATVVWVYLEKLVEVPDNILWDVKILFATLFINSIIGTATSVFGVSTFAENKLYLSSIRNIESCVARAVVLLLLYILCAPKIYYLGITSLMVGVYCAVYNYHYVRKLTPYLKVRRKYFDFKAVVKLVSSGIWNLVTRLSQILTDGLDLLITNALIGATEMGILAIAKTVPSAITGIVGSMVGSFSPNFTELYAKNQIDELKSALKQSMKIMGIIANFPIIVLIVCGERFFTLWQPTQNAHELQILSILTCAGLIVNGGINCIYNIFTVVNKLKFNSIVSCVTASLSVVIVFIILKTTNLGIYAVAGVSTVLVIIKNLFIIVPYSAKCLNLKWFTFYPEVIRHIMFVMVSSLFSYFAIKYIPEGSWFNLIICAGITGIISFIFGAFVVLGKKDRIYVISILKRKVFRK